MLDTADLPVERIFTDQYELNATDLGFFSGASYGQCDASKPPSVQSIKGAKAEHQAGLYLYGDSADPESICTSQASYEVMIRWAQNLHRAGVGNLVTQESVPRLYNDGLGSGGSAVDIWTMLPLARRRSVPFATAVNLCLAKGAIGHDPIMPWLKVRIPLSRSSTDSRGPIRG